MIVGSSCLGRASRQSPPNSAAPADGNRAAGAPSAVDFRVGLPRLSGKTLAGRTEAHQNGTSSSSSGLSSLSTFEPRSSFTATSSSVTLLAFQFARVQTCSNT